MVENKKHKIRTFDLIMAFIVTTLGALFFVCITRSLAGESILNPWFSAMICAVAFMTFLSLFAITTAKKKMIIPIVIIAFLPSVIFMPVVWHMGIVFIAMLIAIKGLYLMRQALFNVLKIDIGIIVRNGISYVTLALVIVITSQYYFHIKQNSEVIFDASQYVKTSNILVDYILKSGGMENVSINTMTVEEFSNFIIEQVSEPKIQENRVSKQDEGMMVRFAGQIGVDIEEIENEANKQTSDQMLLSMSELVGREIKGNEFMGSVISEIISKKVDDMMTKNEFLKKHKINIFTLVFFLIIYSLASLVKIGANLSSRFIFMLLREFKVIRIAKVQKDVEVIAL